MTNVIRHAAVAGAFYPGLPKELTAQVRGYLDCKTSNSNNFFPKGLILPHAGYIYSGTTAGLGYAFWRDAVKQNKTKKPNRIVLLGPTHRVPFSGVALSGVDIFATPLGQVSVDKDMELEISSLPNVITLKDAHIYEHCLEVHLPFLQTLFKDEAWGDFTFLPLLVGSTEDECVQKVCESFLNYIDVMFIISSDLSHYLPYDVAGKIDKATTDAILSLDGKLIDSDEACGAKPIRGFLKMAKKANWESKLIDLRNSGDTAGDKKQVVGYGAYAFG